MVQVLQPLRHQRAMLDLAHQRHVVPHIGQDLRPAIGGPRLARFAATRSSRLGGEGRRI